MNRGSNAIHIIINSLNKFSGKINTCPSEHVSNVMLIVTTKMEMKMNKTFEYIQ